MTLYADMLFLINFIMNLFVLWIVRKITRSKKKIRWLLLGAGVMSLMYTAIVAVYALRFANVLLSSVIILAVGVLVTFGYTGRRSFIKQMLAAYIITFVVGGLGMSLFFLTDLPYAVHFLVSDMGFARAISWQLVLAGTAVSYVLIKLCIKFYEHHTLKRQLLCNVQICMGENEAAFDALVDTGHTLKDPLSQAPVIIGEFEQVKDLLPDRLKVLFYENNETKLTELVSCAEDTFYKRIRMIPFVSLGRTNGMLIAFRPDMVHVQGIKHDAIVGIYNNKLCQSGRYHGLLSPELIS